MPYYEVRLHDAPIGQIVHDDARNRSSFHLLDEYRRMTRRPALGQYFEDDLSRTYTGKRGALPPWFANLVPEGALRALLCRSLQLPQDADLPILVAVGRDLPGAAEIIPAEIAIEHDGIAQEDPEQLDTADLKGPSEEAKLVLRFSLPGVQMKFSVLKDSETITLPAHGRLGDWIVKLDSRRFPRLVENEFATMEWARAAGFDVPACQLLDRGQLPEELAAYAPEGSPVFLIRRYDRAEGRRIHQEDFAQVVNLPPEKKYDQVTYEVLARLARGISGEAAYEEIVRRLTFMVASGNTDAHLKNWSLLYPDGVNAELSPLYDQVATIAWPEEISPEWSLKFAGIKPLLSTDREAFARLAERAGGDVRQTLRIVDETLVRLAAAWSDAGVSSLMPRDHADGLREYWSKSPLLRAHELRG